jgi:hypothetical protein
MVMARSLLGAVAVTLGAGAFGGCNAVLAVPELTLEPHVTCVDGACVCDPGFGDCDGTPGDDCATNLGTNPDHCGACGHGCLGGACKEGRCQPVVLATISGDSGLSVRGRELYVGTCDDSGRGDAFRKLPVGGGDLVTAIRSDHCGVAQVMLGDKLYWGDTSTILVTQLAPVGVPAVVAADASPWKIVASDTHVYWGQLDQDGNDLGIMRLALGAGVSEHVYPNPTYGIAADAAGVYWGGDEGVFGLPNGTTLPLRVSMLSAYDLQIDATTYYIGTTDGIYTLPRKGGTEKLLVPHARAPYLVTDATTLFWLDNGTSSVNQVPLAGGEPTVLASGYSFHGTSAIAIDETAVYWLSSTTLARVAR